MNEGLYLAVWSSFESLSQRPFHACQNHTPSKIDPQHSPRHLHVSTIMAVSDNVNTSVPGSHLKPVVIGLYGLLGSGKSTFVAGSQVKTERGRVLFLRGL